MINECTYQNLNIDNKVSWSLQILSRLPIMPFSCLTVFYTYMYMNWLLKQIQQYTLFYLTPTCYFSLLLNVWMLFCCMHDRVFYPNIDLCSHFCDHLISFDSNIFSAFQNKRFVRCYDNKYIKLCKAS